MWDHMTLVMHDMNLTLFAARLRQTVRHPRERVLGTKDVANRDCNARVIRLVTQDPPLAVLSQRTR